MAAATSSDRTRYRLAVTTGTDDRDAAVAILQQTLGMNAIDAKTRLRHIPAVWPEQTEREAAEAAGEKLRALGAMVAVVPAAEVPDLHTARMLHHVQCRDDGFVIMSMAGTPEQVIAWEDIGLLSIAEVSGLHREMIGGVPDGVFRHDPGIVESAVTDHGPELWLIVSSPLRGYRIIAELMNYEYLRERRSPRAAENLRLLVADVLQHAPNLRLTPSAEAYVQDPSGVAHRIETPAAHRDGVAANWALELFGNPHSHSRHLQSRVLETVSGNAPLVDERLVETHRRLQEEVEALRNACQGILLDVPADPSVVRQQIAELQKTLDDHFRLEEEGGYMQSALDAAPRMQSPGRDTADTA